MDNKKKLSNHTQKKLNKNSNKNNTTQKMSFKELVAKKKKEMFAKIIEDPVNYLKTLSTDQIAKFVSEASFEYYKGTPIVSDDIFDIMKNILKERDPENPVLDEIGAPAPGEKVKLPYWMGSLDKIREDEKALNNWKTKHSGEVVISDKLDGNSAMLVYHKNIIKMYSRGDGLVGQDVSHIIPYIKGIPKKVAFVYLAVRGELIIPKDKWDPKYGANARNAVAGVMHSKHPNEELAKIIQFVAYEQLHPRDTISNGLKVLEENKFIVVYNEERKVKDLTMDSLSTILLERREESEYEIDGIVIFHNAEHNQVVGKNPSYAFAFKSLLTHTEAEVVVKQVEWNASKDGYLKPLLYFDPVVLAGATIQKATAFNAQYIETNTIGPGSRIIIIRSGDVIPHIVRILSKSASGKPSFPDLKYKWNDTHVDIMLEDKEMAEDVIVKRMTHFAGVLEMKGVGAGIIERLYNNGIDTIKKLINVTEEQLVKMEGFQKKSAQKVVNEIRSAIQKADCLTFMIASNLFGRSIGEKKLKLIVGAFPDIMKGVVPTEKELLKIEGIASVTANQFIDGLPKFFDFMKDIGIPCDKATLEEPKVEVPIPAGKSLKDLVVVFTGARDKELEKLIESRGGKIGSSVSSKTTVVVAKDPSDLTGKVKTAKDLGIAVVNFETFKKEYI